MMFAGPKEGQGLDHGRGGPDYRSGLTAVCGRGYGRAGAGGNVSQVGEESYVIMWERKWDGRVVEESYLDRENWS